MPSAHIRQLLGHEASSILSRLELMRPFSEQNPMVAAAAVATPALNAIERGLSRRRWRLRQEGARYLLWLNSAAGRAASAAEAQKKLVRVRARFSGLLSEFDIFSDVLTQRSEHRVGQLLGGMDFAAADMMHDDGFPFEAPHVITYLDRGYGAAIRRALTVLPSGGPNPVAVVRVPRERVGSTGLAGSVAHEVGHQAAALLQLVPALQAKIAAAKQGRSAVEAEGLEHYASWSSEILADYWAVGRVGVAHTLGLFALLSLPSPYVFLGGKERVHPIPWIRVHISAALGDALWPHPQWHTLAARWSELYPPAQAGARKQRLLRTLLSLLPEFVRLLVAVRTPAMGARSLFDLMARDGMGPRPLLERFREFQASVDDLRRARPSEVFAVLGQARASSALSAADETSILDTLLLDWAVRRQRPEGWARPRAAHQLPPTTTTAH